MKAGSKLSKELVVISHPASAKSDERLAKLAGWMGVPNRKITVGQGSTLDSVASWDASTTCGAISIDTLARVTADVNPAELSEFLSSRFAALLVVSDGRSCDLDALLGGLTAGEVRSQSAPAEVATFDFSEAASGFSKQLAGLGLSLSRRPSAPAFGLASESSAATSIMLGDGRPVFLHTLCGRCPLFLFAASQIPDIDQRLSHRAGFEDFYHQIIPLLIFFRTCFGSGCWHGNATTARLIIDDPLLREKYGFLDYGSLLNSMRATGYGTTIAFIPWNHWRTSKNAAERLFDGGSQLSICVHGCDHTNKEFGGTDQATLQWKAATAIERMQKHEQRTDVPFDPVMVFPQGWFSAPALSALRAQNFLAAVNSTCFPINADADPLTIADFLRPAVTRYDGFPLFQRRYPKRVLDSAFDLFLGRPALLVEHHQYFEDGCAKLEAFVSRLQKVEPNLEWATLSSQLTKCCLLRSDSEEHVDVEFFTRRFQLTSTQGGRARFKLSKHEPDPNAIAAVSVNGAIVPFAFEKQSLVMEVEADPGEVVNVEIVDRPDRFPEASSPGLNYQVGVPVRRVLSEFRDNTLAYHPRLLSLATGVAKKLRATPDHDREQLLTATHSTD